MKKRVLLGMTALLLALACEGDTGPTTIEKGEITGPRNITLYLSGFDSSNSAILMEKTEIVVRNASEKVDTGYRIRMATCNIFAGDDMGKIKRHRLELNKALKDGDTITISGIYDLQGQCTLKYN